MYNQKKNEQFQEGGKKNKGNLERYRENMQEKKAIMEEERGI